MTAASKWIKPFVVISVVLAAAAILYGVLLRHDPVQADMSKRLLGPSLVHPLGTDHLGRDLLTRILVGAKMTIGYSLLAVFIAVLIGVSIGVFSGYAGGVIDRLFMRIADAFLSFPDTIAAIILTGLLGPSMMNLIIAVIFVKWVGYARLVRSTVFTEKQKDYILQAQINGLSTSRIMKKHLFPHVIGHVFILATIDAGKIILLISAMSYIGLGAQPPEPEWGTMLNEARPYFSSKPSLMVIPGVTIALTVMVIHLFGDYLRDRFDVRREA
ncbi:ABC transporter permease subunit [Bacillus subtilis]|nr:nickel transporter permease [Bacillus subtilis]TYS09128.1 ABC transporter permease subunit [Bacillus subtilis]